MTKNTKLTKPQQQTLSFLESYGYCYKTSLVANGYDVRAANNLVKKGKATFNGYAYEVKR